MNNDLEFSQADLTELPATQTAANEVASQDFSPPTIPLTPRAPPTPLEAPALPSLPEQVECTDGFTQQPFDSQAAASSSNAGLVCVPGTLQIGSEPTSSATEQTNVNVPGTSPAAANTPIVLPAVPDINDVMIWREFVANLKTHAASHTYFRPQQPEWRNFLETCENHCQLLEEHHKVIAAVLLQHREFRQYFRNNTIVTNGKPNHECAVALLRFIDRLNLERVFFND